jgi:hypothetical protein
MSLFDAEFNSASSTTTFRASTSLGVNISKIYLRQKPVFRAKVPLLPDDSTEGTFTNDRFAFIVEEEEAEKKI